MTAAILLRLLESFGLFMMGVLHSRKIRFFKRVEVCAMKCWEKRGCDPEMEERCPHADPSRYSPCPQGCRYAGDCDRPAHKFASDVSLLLDATVDRSAAIKETCMTCEFFLQNGPRISGGGDSGAVGGRAAGGDENVRSSTAAGSR